MNYKFCFSIIFAFLSFYTYSQKNDGVLFTVEGEPIKSSEFIRVYKKNLDLVKDDSQKDIDAYLDLFVNYQLKLKEAHRLGLDTMPKYLKEFDGYRKQLTKNYISDNKVTDALLNEAYQRYTQDVKASHILVRLDENERDTLKVYNQLVALRERVKKEGFEKVQQEVHDGQNIFAEDLGYFSAFKMVYPFETAAYNTKVGEISMPFRTSFGYHIVKVDDKRPSLGEVTVAHIMVTKNPNDSLSDPEVRINEIYRKLNQGENFEALARQFSDDKSSSGKGGLLNPFTGGQLNSMEFEKEAFALQDKGDVSKPFKTQYGWHIVKLIDKQGVKSFDEMRGELLAKVKRDSRSSLISSTLANKLKTKYGVKDDLKHLDYFVSILNPNYYQAKWELPEDFKGEQTLFKIQDEVVTYQSFGTYLASAQKKYFQKTSNFKSIVDKEYSNFVEMKVLEYHENNLELVNEEFAQILKEYRDGLLLFDLMEKEVWNAAAQDSVGLKQYYDTHKSDYVWKDRVDVLMATSAKEQDILQVKELLSKKMSEEDIKSEMNSTSEQKVIFTKGIMETDNQALPKDLELKAGISKVYFNNDAYHVLVIKEVLPSSTKTFEEAKGKVISDYQTHIEEKWMQSLKDRYSVKVNKDELKKVKSQINK